ncbi:hypothetical protein B4U79_13728, partial [Dinothrombium tinctorium]
IPNALGSVICGAQLLLFVIFPRKSKQK